MHTDNIVNCGYLWIVRLEVIFFFSCVFSILYGKIRGKAKRRKENQKGRPNRDGNKAKMHPGMP